jgi:hypothetical protein
MRHDPTSDLTLLELKKRAVSEEWSGPHRKGVLEVVEAIERNGSFTPHLKAGLIGLMATQRLMGKALISEEVHRECQAFLGKNGWSLEEGIEYASGVRFAEQMLPHFRYDES